MAMKFHSGLLGKKRRQSGELSLARRDGTRVVARVMGAPILDSKREVVGLISVLTDSSDRVRMEHEARVQEQQAEVAALLGARALQSSQGDQDSVLTEAVEAVRRVLQSECSLVVDIGDGGNTIRVSSPHSPDPGPIPSGSRSLTGYTALAGTVVVVKDFTRDRRLEFAPRPMEFGLRSAIAAPVLAPKGVRAVLIAANTKPHTFDQSSAHFMQSMANVVGTALRRA
jgi:transcriptional regulator with GAF, ATPase, and Fis domain